MFISRKQFEREMAKVRDEVYEHMSREQQYSRTQDQIWKLEERVRELELKMNSEGNAEVRQSNIGTIRMP